MYSSTILDIDSNHIHRMMRDDAVRRMAYEMNGVCGFMQEEACVFTGKTCVPEPLVQIGVEYVTCRKRRIALANIPSV